MLKDDDPNILETAFHNGEDFMRGRILEKLSEEKGRAMGIIRATITDIMEMTRRM